MKRASPFFELTQIQGRLNQLFDALAEARGAYASSVTSKGRFLPEADVYESPDAMVAVFELPGVTAAALRVRVESGHLVIEGEKSRGRGSVEAVGRARFHCVERGYGAFRRAVAIVCPVNSLAATATLANGVLTVTLPKVEERRGRVVEIPVKATAKG